MHAVSRSLSTSNSTQILKHKATATTAPAHRTAYLYALMKKVNTSLALNVEVITSPN
jgi:hypothetical protein